MFFVFNLYYYYILEYPYICKLHPWEKGINRFSAWIFSSEASSVDCHCTKSDGAQFSMFYQERCRPRLTAHIIEQRQHVIDSDLCTIFTFVCVEYGNNTRPISLDDIKLPLPAHWSNRTLPSVHYHHVLLPHWAQQIFHHNQDT